MTPLEWSITGLLVAPFVSWFGILFLHRELGTRIFAVLITLTGLAGVISSVNVVAATEPFLLPTNLFFGMTAVLDKFSGIFLLLVAIIMTMAGGYRMISLKTYEKTIATATAMVLIIIGGTWVFLSANIIGLAASLLVLLTGVFLAITLYTTPHDVWNVARWFGIKFGGILAIVGGLFILSSGAFFNDFSTITYIAAELDTTRIAISFISILFGVMMFANLWPFFGKGRNSAMIIKDWDLRALSQIALFVTPIYVTLRILLFLFPQINIWYALSIGIVSILTIVSSTHIASQQNSIHTTAYIYASGVAFFMISIATIFQVTGAYELMNVALFATILWTLGIGTAQGASEYYSQKSEKAGIGHMLKFITSCGLPPSMAFLSIWMLGSVIFLHIADMNQFVRLWLVISGVLFTFSLVRRGTIALSTLKKECIRASFWAIDWRNDSAAFMLLILGIVGAFFAPLALVSIGAGPLTIAAEDWKSGLVAGDSVLRLSVLFFVFIGAGVIFWLARDKSLNDEDVHVDTTFQESRDEERQQTRLSLFRHDVVKLTQTHLLIPIFASVSRLHSWHDTRASRAFSPSLIIVLFVLILTLAIAL